MGKFRKLPVEIEARQITADTIDAVVQWCHGRRRGARLPIDEQFVQIDTLEGEMSGQLGDWIIRGVQGEFYPCKPDIFEATYEPAGGE